MRETAESQNPLQTTVKTSVLVDREGTLGEVGSWLLLRTVEGQAEARPQGSYCHRKDYTEVKTEAK